MSGRARHRRGVSSGGPSCNACGRLLKGQKLYYRVKTRITCEPNELSFTQEDLERDHAAELERISRSCEGRDPMELEEEVFVLLDYHLCAACKAGFVDRVRGR
ncbi:MAG: hypothetical protein HY924_11195 [Elusimicrobia bacterium]|nr:hypothetical protein [Elusimicrobiota bacterium]